MKGEILFEKMAGISEEYITEAALVPALGASPAEKPESRFAALSRALNSGWGVACICFIVAIAAVVGMVAWGRMGDPVGPGYTPPAQGNFSFSHSVSLLSGPVPVGSDLRLNTSVKNEGAPFTYEGSSMGYAPTAELVHAETGYSIEGYFPMTKDYVTFTVNTGDVGECVQTFSIPEDAPTGVYDLVLSYGGERQVFSRMISVVIPTDTPIIYSDYSFGYEPFGGFAIPGDRLAIETWVRNDGYLFTFTGSSMGFAPAAVLIHSDTGYRIEGMFDVTDDYTEVTVKPGDVGRATQEFFIPADAPTGDYDLELSYDSFSQRFDNVLTVAEPTVIDPAVLYNLTMPIGSDWLYEPIDEAYVDGELVTVRIKFATDVGTLFFLNDEVIDAVTGDDQLGYWEYSFYMPKKDSVILFHTYDGMAPYYKMLEACICSNPSGFREDLFYYYGEFGDGVMVALQLGYGEAIWSTTVGGYTFVTPNTHDMLAFYNGALYELQEAYDMGLLTDEDLETMLITHEKWFPDD